MSSSDLLLKVTRGPLAESLHRGHIAVADPSGRIFYSSGDPEAFVFARSSMKPVQALQVMEAGAADIYGFTTEEIAILCASHNGEVRHTATVASMLNKLRLPQQCLLCGPHIPFDPSAAAKLAEAGHKPSELHNNCSGKHAGMLALALVLKADTKDYMNPDHPVQQCMLDTVSQMAGFPRDQIILGTDGCGVPVFGLPLNRLAAAYARLGALSADNSPSSRSVAARRIVEALRAHPFQLAGTGRYDTRLIEATRGRIIGKMGAEGVFALMVPSLSMGLALKIEDGSQRAIYPAVTEALLQLGWLTASEGELLKEFHKPQVRNWKGTHVGAIEPVFQLHSRA
ncbi:MAG: asparaginase [Paenibacillaceae bacterium]|jgi:L-asparaginase II|nr:asparaginase [Paenibacillaceae bacterium]